jgi:hypothetical protein
MSSFISTGPVTVLATQPTKQLLGDSKFPDLAEYDLPALPPSFPPAMVGELAWSGEDFVSESAFVYELTAADKDEITAGLAHFRGEYSTSYARRTRSVVHESNTFRQALSWMEAI